MDACLNEAYLEVPLLEFRCRTRVPMSTDMPVDDEGRKKEPDGEQCALYNA